MDDASDAMYAYPGGYTAALCIEVGLWALVLVVGLVRFRGGWPARIGTVAALLGGTAAVVYLVDHLVLQADTDVGLGPIAEHDLYAEMLWARQAGLVLLGVAFVLLLRRKQAPPATE